jgi:hypothetical protein
MITPDVLGKRYYPAPSSWDATLPTVRDWLTDFKTHNCGAVSRRARNQLERKTIPNIANYSMSSILRPSG